MAISTEPTHTPAATLPSVTPLDLALSHPVSRARLRERIAVTTEAARRAGAYLAGAPSRSVAPTTQAVAALETFKRELQDQPRSAFDVLRELDTVASPATVVQAAGRYFGYVNGGVEPAAVGAAILAGAWDQNLGLPVMSPAAAVLDEVAGRWVLDLLGLPADATATFTPGASLANLTGIIAGRDALLDRLGWSVATHGLAGAPRLRVLVGNEVHASALKALRLAGFGSAQIERLAVDDAGAVLPDALPESIGPDCLVLLQAGNVTTGASDAFAALIPAARAAGAWVHIDGAFGLWAAASPRYAHLVAGVEHADSWATDAHKWLNAPYDSGIAIVRSRADLQRAMGVSTAGISAAYLENSSERPLMELTLQMSQRARGVETWALLAARGRAGVAELIDNSCERAAQFSRELAKAGVEVLVEPVLNQVPVAFGVTPGAPGDDATTAAVIAAVQAEGTMWAGSSQWRGRTVMRISVSDAATTRDDVTAAVDAIVRCWEQVREA